MTRTGKNDPMWEGAGLLLDNVLRQGIIEVRKLVMRFIVRKKFSGNLFLT